MTLLHIQRLAVFLYVVFVWDKDGRSCKWTILRKYLLCKIVENLIQKLIEKHCKVMTNWKIMVIVLAVSSSLSVCWSVCPSHFSGQYLLEFSFMFHEIFRIKNTLWEETTFSLFGHIDQISALWWPKNGHIWYFPTIIRNTENPTEYMVHTLFRWIFKNDFIFWPDWPMYSPLVVKKNTAIGLKYCHSIQFIHCVHTGLVNFRNHLTFGHMGPNLSTAVTKKWLKVVVCCWHIMFNLQIK